MTAQADRISFQVDLAHPVMLAGKKQTTFLRIGLTGCRVQQQTFVPLNIALVIDQSASMQGEKNQQAKGAAVKIIERLRADDRIALVTYNHHANIVLPATKATDKNHLKKVIHQLKAGGQTALFDGVEKGAMAIRQFWDRHQINRIILVSDGLANVGPNSPDALGLFGTALSRENIAVTTIGLGLGYHEDLMMQLAKKSDGNHAFVENVQDLSQIFVHELNDIFSVVVQEVNVTIICTEGVHPVRVLGREAAIQSEKVSVKLNQLYSEQEKYVLLELEILPKALNQKQVIAGVAVVYRHLGAQTTARLSQQVVATFTDLPQLVEEQTQISVMTAAIEQRAVEENKRAVQLRDIGKMQAAQQTLLNNAQFLAEEAAKYHSNRLDQLKSMTLNDAQNLAGKNWVKQRKSMRRTQYQLETQQKY